MDISQYRVLYCCLKVFHGLFSHKLTILDLFDMLLKSAGILQIMQAHNATLGEIELHGAVQCGANYQRSL